MFSIVRVIYKEIQILTFGHKPYKIISPMHEMESTLYYQKCKQWRSCALPFTHAQIITCMNKELYVHISLLNYMSKKTLTAIPYFKIYAHLHQVTAN